MHRDDGQVALMSIHIIIFHRVKAYVVHGLGENDYDTASLCCSTARESSSQSPQHMQLPESGWKSICTMPPADFNFNMSQIVAYFVTRSVLDGQIAGDNKSINKSAENLFTCGHVQNIEFVNVDCWMYIKAKCLPEMRKDRVYILKLVLKLK